MFVCDNKILTSLIPNPVGDGLAGAILQLNDLLTDLAQHTLKHDLLPDRLVMRQAEIQN